MADLLSQNGHFVRLAPLYS